MSISHTNLNAERLRYSKKAYIQPRKMQKKL